MSKLSSITVHGRFQPPLHINHWEYVWQGFELAEHVTILITNPFQDESFEVTASWRNSQASNPFSYDERVFMFKEFFKHKNISPAQYTLRPFNIKDDAAFAELDRLAPNLVNVYSEWSAKKVSLFESQGLKVIRLNQPKFSAVSGTSIRELIQNTKDASLLPELLINAGFMQEAIPGLLKILSRRSV